MVFSRVKFNKYSNYLYEGMVERYTKKKKSGGKRITPTSAQGKDTIKNCKGKCVICGALYIENPSQFDIHHVDGNRGNTHTDNLVLLCANHHRQVGEEAKKRLANYKTEVKTARNKVTRNIKAKSTTKTRRRSVKSFQTRVMSNLRSQGW